MKTHRTDLWRPVGGTTIPGLTLRSDRRLKAWHVSGGVLVVAVACLLIYAFWPKISGTASEEARLPVDESVGVAARVEVVVVSSRAFTLRTESTGRLAPWRRAEISAEASGVVLERPIEEGRLVEAGDLLVRIDDRDQQIELAESEAALLKTRVVYAVNTLGTDSTMNPDTTRLVEAGASLRHAEAAYADGLLSRHELDDARRRFEAAEVLSGIHRGAVGAAVHGLSEAEQRLARAQLALDRACLNAPFSGRLADLDVEVGQRITAGQTLFSLLDDSRMKVDVDVLEADLVRLHAGASAHVRIPALGDVVVEGAIYSINPVVDPSLGTGRVTVAIPNPEGHLIGGLFAYVALETERLTDRLVVPVEAVLVRQGRDLVFRVVDGCAQWVYVTIGSRSGDEVEIVEGLNPGDTVAVAGHYALAHDAPVEILMGGG